MKKQCIVNLPIKYERKPDNMKVQNRQTAKEINRTEKVNTMCCMNMCCMDMCKCIPCIILRI